MGEFEYFNGFYTLLINYQSRDDGLEELIKKLLQTIKFEFEVREQCGLIINKLKPEFGNTNDGHTARCFFFDKAEISVVIAKIDKVFINKMDCHKYLLFN